MKARRRLLSVLLAVSLILVILVPSVLADYASEDIQALYNGQKAYSHIEALTAFGPRVAGGPKEWAAADYIKGQMESYGLQVAMQEFPVLYFEDHGSALEVVGGATLTPRTMTYSPPGEFTVQIVNCGLGYPEDIPAAAAGKICLIRRGSKPPPAPNGYFWFKTENAYAAGALAAVIYNNTSGQLLGSLTKVTPIPAVGIPQSEGELLLSLLAGGPVTVHLKVDTAAANSHSHNVVGTLAGTDPAQGIVYMGGHYDSVFAGVGANDDASGVAATLEAARVLAKVGHTTKATLKFLAFGAEEIGLNGSYAYVDANEDEVSSHGLGMVNLDMIAVGDTRNIGNIGWAAADLENFAGAKATAMGLPWQFFTAGSNSDHTYFEQVGVPAAFIYQSPDPYYHTAQDGLDKISLSTLEANGELATATMYDWAKNPALREKKAAKLDKVQVYKDEVYSAD